MLGKGDLNSGTSFASSKSGMLISWQLQEMGPRVDEINPVSYL